MTKKSSILINLSEKLLKLAPATVDDGFICTGFVGEPKLPEKLKKIK